MTTIITTTGMTTGTGTGMTTTIMTTPDTARLQLVQFLSPAFPVGGFAWSQGLEYVMDQGVVTQATLPQWLADWLDHGAGWTDAVLVALSLRADADHAALDDLARATCLTSERLAETVEQGTAFAANITALTGQNHPPAALPVAFGRACAAMPLPVPEIIAAFLLAQVQAQISAAIRFLPMGPVLGQTMLAAMHAAILTRATAAATATQDDLASATWGADMAQMHHETMTTRIFRS
jgi:urease accessory protein